MRKSWYMPWISPEVGTYLVESQRQRFEALVAFCETISREEVQQKAEQSNTLFGAIISFTMYEYGMRSTTLASVLQCGRGKIDQWVSGYSFPRNRAARSDMVKKIAAHFHFHIASEQARKAANDAEGVPTILQGSVR